MASTLLVDLHAHFFKSEHVSNVTAGSYDASDSAHDVWEHVNALRAWHSKSALESGSIHQSISTSPSTSGSTSTTISTTKSTSKSTSPSSSVTQAARRSAVPADVVVVNAFLSAASKTGNAHIEDTEKRSMQLFAQCGATWKGVTLLSLLDASDKGTALRLDDPRILGARFSVHEADVAAVIERLGHEHIQSTLLALEKARKPLFVYAVRGDALAAIIMSVPSGVRVVVDHLGAPLYSIREGLDHDSIMTEYRAVVLPAVCRRLKTSSGGILLRGPLYRAGILCQLAGVGERASHAEISVISQQLAAAAIAAVGAEHVVLWGSSDAPAVALPKSVTQHLSSWELTDRSSLMSTWQATEKLSPTTLKTVFPASGLKILQRYLDVTLPTSGNSVLRAQDLVRDARMRWHSECAMRSPLIHYPTPSWFLTRDRIKESMLGVQLCTPLTVATDVADVAIIIGSGYTGVQSFYPTLFAQALTREGYACYSLEYNGYGSTSGDPARISLADQRDAFRRGAEAARDDGYKKIVGLAWGMGALGLYGAASQDQSLYDTVISCNGLLRASTAHRDVLSRLNAERDAVEEIKRNTPSERAAFIDLPPEGYNAFVKKIRALQPNKLYGGFVGYPLDILTLRVVLRELAGHIDWAGIQQHGAFFQELLDQDITTLELSPQLDHVVLHGRSNRLHSCSHARGVADTLIEKYGQDRVVFRTINGCHNDFMQFESPIFQHEMLPHLVAAVGNCSRS